MIQSLSLYHENDSAEDQADRGRLLPRGLGWDASPQQLNCKTCSLPKKDLVTIRVIESRVTGLGRISTLFECIKHRGVAYFDVWTGLRALNGVSFTANDESRVVDALGSALEMEVGSVLGEAGVWGY